VTARKETANFAMIMFVTCFFYVDVQTRIGKRSPSEPGILRQLQPTHYLLSLLFWALVPALS